MARITKTCDRVNDDNTPTECGQTTDIHVKITRHQNMNLRCRVKSAYVGVVSYILLACIVNQPTPTVGGKCEPIKVPECMHDIPWNLTHMPNLVHHSSQENAKLVLSQFEGLLAKSCSRYLKFYLCSMFTPMCFHHEGEFPKIVPPCRKICVDARDNCEPIMLKFNVTWPEQFSCEELPEYHRGMCITPEAFIARAKPSTDSDCTPPNPAVKRKKCKRFKPKPKAFTEKRYDFVIAARIEKLFSKPCSVSVRVLVTHVLRSGAVEIGLGENLLVFNNTCKLRIKRRREYVLAGHENIDTGDLILHEGSVMEKWGKKWEVKLSKWMKGKVSRTGLYRNRRNQSTAPPKGEGAEEEITNPKKGKKKRGGGGRRKE